MIVIWPQYIDKNLSLNEGRKVSREYAVSEPSINDIERALKRMGIKTSVQKEKSYPRKWYEKSGRVLAESEEKKLDLLRNVCDEIKKMRK